MGKARDLFKKIRDTKGKFHAKMSTIKDRIANIHWIIEKAREFQENIYFCFTDYATAFDCVDHNKL